MKKIKFGLNGERRISWSDEPPTNNPIVMGKVDSIKNIN